MVKRVKSTKKKKNGTNGNHANGMVSRTNGAGRPTKYDQDYPRQAAKLCKLGATDADLADFFKVDITTIYAWMSRHTEFSQSIKMSKDAPDDLMERSLYMRGRGFWIDTEKLFMTKDGDVIREPTREYYPPDTAAAFIWLKNRRPNRWRDKHEIDVSGKVEHTFTLNIFEDYGNKMKTIPYEKKQVERVR